MAWYDDILPDSNVDGGGVFDYFGDLASKVGGAIGDYGTKITDQSIDKYLSTADETPVTTDSDEVKQTAVESQINSKLKKAGIKMDGDNIVIFGTPVNKWILGGTAAVVGGLVIYKAVK